MRMVLSRRKFGVWKFLTKFHVPELTGLAVTQFAFLANLAPRRLLCSLRHPWLATHSRRSLRIAAHAFTQKLRVTL